jgi:hypothetical protein
MSSGAPRASENPSCEYSTESTRHLGNISKGARVSAHSRGDDGTAGTDGADGVRVRGVLTSSSMTERRRAHGPARKCPTERPKCARRRMAPPTPRHALTHLTTLRVRRLRGAWLTAPAVGENCLSAATSVGRRRRITRTRFGCYGRDPRDSGEGIQSPFRSGRGSLCTVILLIGTFRARRAEPTLVVARVVVGAHSFVDHWAFGGTSRGRRLPNRLGWLERKGSSIRSLARVVCR